MTHQRCRRQGREIYDTRSDRVGKGVLLPSAGSGWIQTDTTQAIWNQSPSTFSFASLLPNFHKMKRQKRNLPHCLGSQWHDGLHKGKPWSHYPCWHNTCEHILGSAQVTKPWRKYTMSATTANKPWFMTKQGGSWFTALKPKAFKTHFG